jgi:CBS domain-containing protein
MKVQEIMSTTVIACRPEDSVNQAAQIMWEHDCGAVPVVDADERVVGMLTDRDVCMAAYTQGRPLWDVPVANACSHAVYSCQLNDTLQTAENLMRVAQIRRLPVVDDGGKLRGIVSLGDLAAHVHRAGRGADGLSYQSVALTLAAISQPPSENGQARPAATVTTEKQTQPTASA